MIVIGYSRNLSVEDVWFEKDVANTVVKDSQKNKVFLEETDRILTVHMVQIR